MTLSVVGLNVKEVKHEPVLVCEDITHTWLCASTPMGAPVDWPSTRSISLGNMSVGMIVCLSD